MRDRVSDPGDLWWKLLSGGPTPRRRLFCVPYAGGHAMLFKQWHLRLPPDVGVWALQLPGRGTRWREPPLARMADLLRPAATAMRELLDRPYALFGHSLGALICFELTRRLRHEGRRLPLHLFASGRRAPHLPSIWPCVHDKGDADVIAFLRELDGTPADILRDAEMLEVLLPTLRADIAVTEAYTYTPDEPLPCAVTALGGSTDPETANGALEAWRQHTCAAFETCVLPGAHFFIHTEEAAVLGRIRRDLGDVA